MVISFYYILYIRDYIFTIFVELNISDSMKTNMKNFRLLFLLATAVSVFMMASCEKEEEPIQDKPDVEVPEDNKDNNNQNEEKPVVPEYPVAENVNTYVINGTEYSFNSIAVMNVGENISIAASPEEGYTDVVDMMTGESEYFFAGVSPTLIGEEFDMMTEQTLFTICSTLAECYIEGVTPEFTYEIQKGICTSTFIEGVMTLKAGIVLANGTTLAVNIVAEENTAIEINANEIGVDMASKPVRASFYMEEDGLTYLYFTPGGISYAEELEIATYYMYLVVDNSLINGKEMEISKIGNDKTFIFAYVDNLTGVTTEISNDNLSSASGTLYLENPAPEHYRVKFEFIIKGKIYYVSYDGECRSALDEKPVPVADNELTFEKETYPIVGAELTKGEEVWTMSMILENGNTADIAMPDEIWESANGNVYGFSQDPNIGVTYNGRTYCSANKDVGTITVTLDQASGFVEIDFTNYKDLKIYYSGAYTTK